MKFTLRHAKQICEYMEKADEKLVLTVDEWSSGTGRRTSMRALPPFTERYERREYPQTALPKHGTPERKAYEFFQANPRRKVCLVMDSAALSEFMFGAAMGKEL